MCPGSESPEALFDALAPPGKPLICAGGVGDAAAFAHMIRMGCTGVQPGTRFIASVKCSTRPAGACLRHRAERVEHRGAGFHYPHACTCAGPIVRWLLRSPRTKHWTCTLYALQWIRRQKRTAVQDTDHRKAGKSVEGITAVEPVAATVAACATALHEPCL